ncbi:hypothetical protein GCM10010387_67530 [Streptomyces inusitatus]|uniref:Uncharacterized protein n=1 Tax=Streptomyces inusitatus TaxID=68221 RepID=A0A918QR17_9ACTN|nr:hypothetical protein [Streptomyces inusitatus]GGZ64941.1 hypothetical protein GCM10010387_67530 [Streptomyces inusitatus]
MSEAPEAPKGAGDLKAALSKKLGPLPVGVWVLAIGGGLTLTWYMRRSGGGGEEVVAEEESGPDTGGTGEGEWPYGRPNGVGQWPTDDGQEDDDDKTLPTTNEQWQRRAVQILVGRGYEPTAVDRAISAYLGGDSLTTIQRAIINEAIILIGPPPVSPPPPTTPDKPPPVIKPPTKPKPEIPPTPTWPTWPPKPMPRPQPKPKPGRTPPYRTMRITKRGQTLSDLTAAYNKKYRKSLTWNQVWDFNLKYRSAATVKELKARGPHKTFVGSSFWFPE